jgi:hypothetical protein
MKTTIAMAAILSSLFFADAKAGDRTELRAKIEQKINSTIGDIPLKPGSRDQVRVSFKVNAQGNIKIVDIDFSDESIKNAFVEKLSKINLGSGTDPNETFYYQFSFEKI